MSVERITLLSWSRGRRQLAFHFGADALRFNTTYWYGDVDLPALEARHGVDAMERLYAHIAAFELNKLVSLAPREIDLGPFARHLTPRLEAVWREVLHRVWAQWRYEHKRPDYAGPLFVSRPADALIEPMAHAIGEVEALAFCGGGKDSLVALKLMERAGVVFDSLAYAVSHYGPAVTQHGLIDGLLNHCKPRQRRRMWVYDDFLDSPVLAAGEVEGVASLTAAETPSSVFAALPLVLQHGYRWLVLGHEASANAGNLVWDATGEEVNHQWGKSLAAERLLAEYIQTVLVEHARYFSVLQPVFDPVIFSLLADDIDAVPSTHSCNVAKPWCERCPKCAYVYLGYLAWLPVETVRGMFRSHLFDTPANVAHYRAMLGLTDHTPFECIGQVDEVRLFFEMCHRKGVGGAAMDVYRAAVPALDWRPIAARHCAVGSDALPDGFAGVLPGLQAAAARARDGIAALMEAR